MLWPGHPEVVFARGMRAIGENAQAHRPVGPDLIGPMIQASRVAPLSPEPFLVRGLALQQAGDEAGAGVAFLAAAQREPRSLPAHFFLADHYTRSGRVPLALAELGRLIRLVPGSAQQLAPRVAAYVQSERDVAQVRGLIGHNPQLRDDVLLALASNAANADLIASIAPSSAQGDWVPVLLQSLVQAGDYQGAYRVWQASASARGTPVEPGRVADRAFRSALPPPFGWTLASGGAGLAEPASGGGLHVIYYGRDPFVAASQLLLLPAGRYVLQFEARATSGSINSVKWQLRCARGNQVVATAPAGPGAARASLAVPAGCPAQWLELVASPADVPDTTDFTIADLDLRRAG